jgi:hypothetical protein
MDRQKCRDLRVAIAEALKSIEDSFKVKVCVGNASFSSASCNFKIEFAELNANGEAETKEIQSFKSLSALYGFQADDLGKEFMFNGKRFKIAGLAPRKSKYPILATNIQEGRTYKFPVEGVLSALGRSSTINLDKKF